MRKIVISLLLASVAATPAMAYAGPREDRAAAREQRKAEREQKREEEQPAEARKAAPAAVQAPAEQPRQSYQRPDRPDRPDRQQQRMERMDRHQNQQGMDAPAVTRQLDRQAPARAVDRAQIQDERQQRQNMFEQRREQRSEARDARRDERIARQQAMKNARPPVVSTRPAPNTQPPAPTKVRPSTIPSYNWSSNSWRNDRRYDWYNYRNKYWWLFQLGNYYDPFGWGYQPYQVGWRMWPSYYSQNYWINDPWEYRLPYAPPGYRWVRYWDDAVLVDTWSGQVVDVIYNFFW